MSIKLELDAASIKNAITAHISNQGFDLAGKSVEVALVNGRGGNGNRATITISDDNVVIKSPHIATPVKREEAVELPEEEDISSNTDQAMYLEQDMAVATPEVDPIMAAAEGAADPFGEEDLDKDSGLFPVVNPEDVEIPKSLF